MGSNKKTKCKNCKRLFIPDYRNRSRQRYCPRKVCRKASKTASQKKWLSKTENKDHFKGSVNVQRVQEWRRQNPGYWRRKRSNKKNALQDPLTVQMAENIEDKHQTATDALQDLFTRQPPVIIGLISNFIGSALQDDIAATLLRMQQSGQDILYTQTKEKGGNHDCKVSASARKNTQNSQKFQLGRSPDG